MVRKLRIVRFLKFALFAEIAEIATISFVISFGMFYPRLEPTARSASALQRL